MESDVSVAEQCKEKHHIKLSYFRVPILSFDKDKLLHSHTLLVEVNNNQWYSQFKINIAFEICIRLEYPEKSEPKNFSKANLEEILLRLDAKGIFHNIIYGIKADRF